MKFLAYCVLLVAILALIALMGTMLCFILGTVYNYFGLAATFGAVLFITVVSMVPWACDQINKK